MAFFPLNDGSDGIDSRYPYTELWDLLVEKTADVGHVLTFDEARLDPKFIDPNRYAIALGGRFSDWAQKAWRTVVIEQEDHMGKRLTKEQIVKELKNFYETEGRLPTQTEMNRNPKLPGYDVTRRKLGNKTEWLNLLFDDETSPSGAEVPSEAPLAEQPPAEAIESIEATPDLVAPPESGVNPVEPQAKVAVVRLPKQDASDKSLTIVELKIAIPGRETPISLNLSF